MAIAHAHPGEVVDIGALGERLRTEKTVALFKSDDLEVMRLVLLAGRSLPPHKVPGDITIHCIEGVMSISADGTSRILRAGQLLYLRGNAMHDVTAIEDSQALVTVALTR